MLSKRERRIIEIQGFLEFALETFQELIEKKEALDELEEALLRATVEEIEVLTAELKTLKQGGN